MGSVSSNIQTQSCLLDVQFPFLLVFMLLQLIDDFMILPRFSREKVIPGTGDQKMSRPLRSQ